jgi:hypothetical protein
LEAIVDIEELPFPAVAAIQGLCITAGMELMLACDLAWAAASARFSQAEATIGTTTLLRGVQRLAERAGPIRAREIIYRADQYDAATFEKWSIVNRAVPDEVLESETEALVARLARGATVAYATGKKIVRAHLEDGPRRADHLVDEIAPALFETEDMRARSMGCSNTGLANFVTRSYSKAASSCTTFDSETTHDNADLKSRRAATTLLLWMDLTLPHAWLPKRKRRRLSSLPTGSAIHSDRQFIRFIGHDEQVKEEIAKAAQNCGKGAVHAEDMIRLAISGAQRCIEQEQGTG